jgi:signal transduction histidine kinase
MTGLIILTFIPLVVAVGFLIRVRAEQQARRAVERQLAELRARPPGAPHDPASEWAAVLAHELRSPVAAILGYEELLEEGTFGVVSGPALDALRRIRFAAAQLISLIDGLEQSRPDTDSLPEYVPARILIDEVLEAVRFDAEGRGTSLHRDPDDVPLRTLRSPALRALVLVLGAAIKGSPNAQLRIAAHDGAVPRISITGSKLDPQRDDGAGQPLSGPALRLQLARASAAPAHATIRLDPDGTLHIDLPRLSPSAAAAPVPRPD